MVLSKDLKIAICFGLIMGAILSLCNLCFATENVENTENIDMSYIDGALISYQMKIIEDDYYGLYYLELDPDYNYDITIDYISNTRLGFSDSVEIGSSVYNFSVFSEPGTYHTVIDGSQIQYIFFNVSCASNQELDYTIIRTKKDDMTSFIDNIAYSLSIGQLSSVWNLVVPILAISVLLGLGFYLLKRLLNRIKRAKGGA